MFHSLQAQTSLCGSVFVMSVNCMQENLRDLIVIDCPLCLSLVPTIKAYRMSNVGLGFLSQARNPFEKRPGIAFYLLN